MEINKEELRKIHQQSREGWLKLIELQKKCIMNNEIHDSEDTNWDWGEIAHYAKLVSFGILIGSLIWFVIQKS